jgi:hypothetical protein
MKFMKGRTGAIVALVLVGGMIGQGSSHREAPGITKTPKLDGTDFYMFRSYEPGREGFVTLVANYVPLQDPYGGPNYFALDPDAVYEIHVDNNGDAVEDITFQFRPSIAVKDLSVPAGGVMVPVPLINIGQIGPDVEDTAALNREESYALNIIRGDRRRGISEAITNTATGSSSFRKPVDNIGLKSIPNYAAYANSHIYDIAIPGCANGRVFVGQRKDPFVVNLGETFDLVNISNPLGAENAEADDLADKNVTSFVLEVPISCVVLSSSQPIMGGWTTASLGVGVTPGGSTPGRPGAGPCPSGQPAAQKPSEGPGLTWVPDRTCSGWVPNGHPAARGTLGSGGTLSRFGAAPCLSGQPAAPKPADSPGLTWVPSQNCDGWVPTGHPGARGAGGPGSPPSPPPAGGTQVSRLGAPLVNEVVIGLKDKDLFNSAEPTQDSALATYVTNPTLPELLEILFGGAGVQAPNNFPRKDLVAAFLTGINGLNQPVGVVASEMLRLNTSIPPVAPGSQSRLGALGGDNAGFPNGRRPGDDVVDIELRVAMGVLCHAFPGAFGCGPADAPSGTLPFTDGAFVDASFFNAAFPYVRTPLPGSPNSSP